MSTFSVVTAPAAYPKIEKTARAANIRRRSGATRPLLPGQQQQRAGQGERLEGIAVAVEARTAAEVVAPELDQGVAHSRQCTCLNPRRRRLPGSPQPGDQHQQERGQDEQAPGGRNHESGHVGHQLERICRRIGATLTEHVLLDRVIGTGVERPVGEQNTGVDEQEPQAQGNLRCRCAEPARRAVPSSSTRGPPRPPQRRSVGRVTTRAAPAQPASHHRRELSAIMNASNQT